MLLRYVPLDKRAFSTVNFNDWGLFSDYMGPFLQNKFYPALAEELGRLNKLELEEGLQLESCDIFDGRLYGHVLRFVVAAAKKSKTMQVKSDAFKFGDYVDEELSFLWSETSSKEKFFPMKLSGLKELDGLDPPDLPAIIPARSKPVLHAMKSELMSQIWMEDFGVKEKDEDAEENAQLLWERYQWKESIKINAVAQEQEMEQNAHQKKLEEMMRKKGKISDKDKEYMRKKNFAMRQKGLRKLHTYAKSLTGSDKLHLPIMVVKEDLKKEEGKKPQEKVSQKQQEMIDKNIAKEQEKIQKQDEKLLSDWEKPVDALLEAADAAKLEKDLLDLLIGYTRVMPSFVGFPALQAFKTPEAQVKIIIKVLKNLQKGLKKMQLDKVASESQPKVRSLVTYVYCLLQEAWSTYGKKGLLDGKGQGDSGKIDLVSSQGMSSISLSKQHYQSFPMAASWIAHAERLVAQTRQRLEIEEDFDDYAEEFEEHLVNVLEYRLPQVFAQKVSKMTTSLGYDCHRVLDLGCGTGLCGRSLRSHLQLDQLVGVDLSAEMLSRAKQQGGYDELYQRDLVVHLQREGENSFDLVMAGDVLIYLGCLKKLMFEVHRVLKNGGCFLFSTELALSDEAPEGLTKRSSGRYAYGRDYIERVASAAGFHILEVETMDLRIEDDVPLPGDCIKLFQEVLISLGFPQNAKGMFEEWKKVVQPEKAEEEDTKEKDKKKGKDKDDKKDKKKDPKDKKDDKKDKKDKKDDKEEDPDSFKVTKEVELVWSGVGKDEYAFQLLYMGPQMTRLAGTQKDARVNFKPDKWQRDLLDIVDNKQSALVVAPTASGKTFIGYYVMDSVLRSDHQGIAVYVAPSKALVNQVSAEIYARFGSKIYPSHSKKELMGVFIKEFNSAGGVAEAGRWKNCQVLVTIPHVLEMLLLSAEYQDWVSQLRYVIFDEVHCIGEQEGGEQWEHCMQLIPCPFIALSATVADPSFFHGWLSRVNTKKDMSKVSIVEHKERWNDLYKYVWHNGEMRPLHPFCCLVESSVRRNGMSADLTLVPREMVQLHQDVTKIIGKNEKWDRLAPSKYFAGMAFVTKIDSRQYEKELKAVFLELLRDNTLQSEGFTQLTLALQQNPESDIGFAPPSRVEEEEATDLRILEKQTSYLQASTLFKLCKDLDSRDIMPAIFFNFSRKEIERMLRKLVEELEKRQYNKYFGDEDAKYRTKRLNERRRAEYEQKKKHWDEAQKMKASAKQEASAARKSGENEGRGGSKAEAVDTSADLMLAEPVEPKDIADEIDAEFTFHSAKALGVWQEDIEATIIGAGKGLDKWMVEGLRSSRHPVSTLTSFDFGCGRDVGWMRGIGMHHEGLRTAYKQAVEVLFRQGYLRVVFATGTLALGINMPCRSTIFCSSR
eukprot:symbB.v1.2.000962.t2/scaffold39.1/size394969/6